MLESHNQSMRYFAFCLLTMYLAGCSTSDRQSPADSTTNDASVVTSDSDLPAQDATLDADASAPAQIVSVGFREFEFTYDAMDSARTLPVFFWYPSSERSGAPVRYHGFLASDNAYKDTTVWTEEPLPVLLFSHGMRGFGAATTPFLAEHFARQGWLVIAWDHVGDTTRDASGSALTYLHRPLDVSAVLDYLYDSDAEHPFGERATRQVLLTGHSRGGYTCLAIGGARFDTAYHDETCDDSTSDFCSAFTQHRGRFETGFRDDRVKALVLFASGDYSRFQSGVSSITIPTLLWTAGDDLNNPNEVDGDPIWAALDGPDKFRFNLENAGHFTYTSLCGFVGGLGVNNGCDQDDYPIENAHRLVNEYTTRFAEGFLLDNAPAQTEFQALTTDQINLQGVEFSKKEVE